MVHIGVEYLHKRQQVINLLEEFQDMWYGHLGQIKATNERINLILDAQPAHQQQYGAGIKAREVECVKVERMPKEGVIKLSGSEWASLVVLIPKPDGTFGFRVHY